MVIRNKINIKSIFKVVLVTGITIAQYNWQEHVPDDGGTPFNIFQYIITVIIVLIVINFLQDIFGE